MPTDSDELAPWSLDEYARRLLARGHPVHAHDGVWWRQVRPQFCWPLDPLLRLTDVRAAPDRRRSLFGYQFATAAADAANSYLNPMVCDELAAYSLDALGRLRRNRIRNGLRVLEIRPVTSAELERDGWQIEDEFYQRTRWRPPPPRARWPAAVARSYAEPIVDYKLGAFAQGRLVAYMTWFGLGRVAHLSHIASSAAAIRSNANDALLYAWLTRVRDSGRYDRATYTVRSEKPSLDAFKDSHRFRLQSLPARLHLNPLARRLLGWSRPAALERLLGLDPDGARRWIAAARSPAADAPGPAAAAPRA